MAIRKAVANGNWSSTSTWNGGTLPQAGDTVHANGYTVTLDQDVDVLELTTKSGTGIVWDGNFTMTTSRTINANIVASPNGGSAAVLVSFTGCVNLVINGNISGGYYNCQGIAWYSESANRTLTVNGNITGGQYADSQAIYMSRYMDVIRINGNITAGVGSRAFRHFGGKVEVKGIVTANNLFSVIELSGESWFYASQFVSAPNGRFPVAHQNNQTQKIGFLDIEEGLINSVTVPNTSDDMQVYSYAGFLAQGGGGGGGGDEPVEIDITDVSTNIKTFLEKHPTSEQFATLEPSADPLVNEIVALVLYKLTNNNLL